MSRLYEMTVTISGYAEDKKDEIMDACKGEWNFDDMFAYTTTEELPKLCGSAQGSLVGGESEDEFAKRLALAIWKANGTFCHIEVCATYMEELPHETYIMDEEEYEVMYGRRNKDT